MKTVQSMILAAGVAAAVLTAASPAAGQSVKVQTSLSEPTVAVGDVVTLQITVTAKVRGTIRVRVPPVDGLTELAQQQSQSQSISLSAAGQQVLIQNVYTIDYRADRPGKYTIGPVSARVGKRSARSTAVRLTVQGEAAIKARAADAAANEVAAPEPEEGTLFLRYRVNRDNPYLGQEVLLDLEIISEPNQGFQVEETTGLPDVEGFWTQILEQPRRLKPRRVTIRGKRYTSYRIWRAALYPLTAGTLTLPPVSMTFSQGAGLFRTGRRFRRRARAVRLEVKPLPSEDRPSDFVSTNVGKYRLTAKVDQKRVPAGKALLYTVRLSGKGNVASAKLPTIGDIPNFRVFAPTVRDDVEADAAGIRGYKEAEYLLMAQKGGSLKIPKIELPIFDPTTGKYRRLTTKAISVRVDGEPDPTTTIAPPPPPPVAAAATPGTDPLRPLRFASDLSTPSPPPWDHGWFWLLLFAPGFASGGVAAWRSSKLRNAIVTPRSPRQTVAKEALDLLAAATADVDEGRLPDAHAKVAEALRSCGSTALDVSLQGLTLDAVAAETQARGLSESDARDLVRLLEAADYARYAPSQLTASATRADIQRAEALIGVLSQPPGGES